MRCDRIVYVSDNEDVSGCPVCSTPLIESVPGQVVHKRETSESIPE